MASHGWKLDKGLGYIGGNDYWIDALRYEYVPNTNRLRMVHDDYSDPNTKMGDFHNGNEPFWGTDYDYDANGNMIKDENKYISSVSYNYLNLPAQINTTKGTIGYTYDAFGNKIKKVVVENNASVKLNNISYSTSITTTSLYLNGIVFESKDYDNTALTSLEYTDKLQFINHEEGRLRYKPATSSASHSYEYDYFIKDHLGNVRMMLTDEFKQDLYPAATLEGNINTNSYPNAVAVEKDYYSIEQNMIVDLPAGMGTYQNQNSVQNPNPYSNTTANSQKVYGLTSTTSAGVTGLGITLKVMSGDRIDIHGRSYWYSNSPIPTSTYPINPIDLLNGLFNRLISLLAP